MNREELSMLGFEIVAYAGDARSSLMTLLKEVRSGNFENVEKYDYRFVLKKIMKKFFLFYL